MKRLATSILLFITIFLMSASLVSASAEEYITDYATRQEWIYDDPEYDTFLENTTYPILKHLVSGANVADMFSMVTDWQDFWQKFNNHAVWSLEGDRGQGWEDASEYLTIQRDYPNATTCKITLIFDAPVTADYRFTFAIDKKVAHYVDRTGVWQFEIQYEEYTIVFDWSDLQGISGLIINKGVQNGYFYFRIKKDNVQQGTHFILDPYVCATSINTGSTRYAGKRFVWYDSGRWWWFGERKLGADDYRFSYTSSTDGITWESPTDIYGNPAGLDTRWNTWFNGTHFVYVVAWRTEGYCSFRMGTLDSDGGITWTAAEQSFQDDDANRSGEDFPVVAQDENGNWWIVYQLEINGNAYKLKATRSDNQDGTFTADAGFPTSLDADSYDGYFPVLVPLDDGDIYILHTSSFHDAKVQGILYNGSMQTQINVTTSTVLQETDDSKFYPFSATRYGTKVLLTFLDSDSDIRVMWYTISTDSWGSESEIEATNADATSFPTVSFNDRTYQPDQLYVFWGYNDHIYYLEYAGEWKSAVDYYTTSNIIDYALVSAYDSAYYNTTCRTISFAFVNGSGAAYTMMYAHLEIEDVESTILEMSFDDESGSTAEDWSGNNHDGTITGATRTYSGYYGKALSFDGSNDYVDLSTDSAFNPAYASLFAWIYVNTSNDGEDYGRIIQLGSNTVGVNIRWRTATNQLEGRVALATAGTKYPVTSALTTGWHHVGITVSATAMYLYVDGVRSGSNYTYSADVITYGSEQGYIGGAGTSNNFGGTIDEVKVFDYALSEAEVLTEMYSAIADYPYNEDVTIENMEGGGDWIFAKERYYQFSADYVRQNSTYPFDVVSIGFQDGLHWINATYDKVDDDYSLSQTYVHTTTLDLEYEVSLIQEGDESTSGNGLTVNFYLMPTDHIVDSIDEELYLYCNNTDGDEDAWEEIQTDYFSIYNIGGLTELTSTNTAGRVTGGDVFQIYGQNDSTVMVNQTWRKLQHWHAQFAVEDPHGGFSAGNIHYQEWNVTFGIYYCLDDSDTYYEGWKVTIDHVGTSLYDASNQFSVFRFRWYWNDVLQKTDYLSSLWEGGTAAATTDMNFTRFWVDLWFNQANSSSVIGGRVVPYYYGVKASAGDVFGVLFGTSGWIPNLPATNTTSFSQYWDDFLDSDGNVISSRRVTMVKLFAEMKRRDFTYNVVLRDWVVYDIRTTQGDMVGINTPPIEETKMPHMSSFLTAPILTAFGGLFNSLYGAASMITKLTVDAIDGLIYTITGRQGVFSDVLSTVNIFLGQLSVLGGYILDLFATVLLPLTTDIVDLLGDLTTYLTGASTWILSNAEITFIDPLRIMSAFFAGTSVTLSTGQVMDFVSIGAISRASLTIGGALLPFIYIGRIARGGLGVIVSDMQAIMSFMNVIRFAVDLAIRALEFAWNFLGKILGLIRG